MAFYHIVLIVMSLLRLKVGLKTNKKIPPKPYCLS